jgi:hypothetical protein
LLVAADGPVVVAQKPRPRPATIAYGASNAQVGGIIAGIAAAGALIGVGAYIAVKHNHIVTGCARSTSDGLSLTSDSDKQSYTLIGDVAGIKSGNRVRLSGKKAKQKSGTQQFLVEKVSKDLGACKVSSASH